MSVASFQFPDDTGKIRKIRQFRQIRQFHSLIFYNLRLFVLGVAAMAAAAELAEDRFAANQLSANAKDGVYVILCRPCRKDDKL